MFTWICPQCGREVPPAYTECPDCTAKQKGEAAAQTAPPQTPAAPPIATGPGNVPGGVVLAPAASVVAARRGGLPTWLLSIMFALAFIGLGGAAYFVVQHFKGNGQAAAAPPLALESPPAKVPAKEHPLQKYIEVTGIRLLEDAKKKTEARFLVVNHSGADVTDLAATVTVLGRTDKAGEEPVGSFSFKLPSLGPYESKEMTAPVNTKLKVYELPDWQNVTEKVQVSAP